MPLVHCQLRRYFRLLMSSSKGIFLSRQHVYDDQFQMSVDVAKLERMVEWYQWTEESSGSGYSYSNGSQQARFSHIHADEVWTSEFIDSSSFQDKKHVNKRSKEFVCKIIAIADPHHC